MNKNQSTINETVNQLSPNWLLFNPNIIFKLTLAIAIYIISTMLLTGHSHAASIQVSGTCSLDNAITSANTNTATGGCIAGDPGLDTVNLPAGTITLTTNPVEYTESITFQGAGVGSTIIDANHTAYYAFSNHSTTAPDVNLTVDGITFKNFGTADGSNLVAVVRLASASGDLSTSNANFEDMVVDSDIGGSGTYNSAIITNSSGTLTVDTVKVLNTEIRHGSSSLLLAPIVTIQAVSPVSVNNFELAGTIVTGADIDNMYSIIYPFMIYSSGSVNLTNTYIHDNNLVDSRATIYGTYSFGNSLEISSFRMSSNSTRNLNSSTSDGGVIGIVGGGISSLLIRNVDISSNTSAAPNGVTGLYIFGGSTIDVSNYSFTENTADYSDASAGYGASVFTQLSDGVTLNLSNSTIANNSGTGAIDITLNQSAPESAMPVANIFNITVADNELAFPGATDLSSIYINSSSNASPLSSAINLQNTLLSNNTLNGSPANCSTNGLLTSSGHNLSSDTTCISTFNQAGDINNVNPLLAPLSTPSGSFGPMRILQATSPAIDAGTSLSSVTNDQRGASRPQRLAYDIGAYEVLADTIIVPTPPTNPAPPAVSSPNTGVASLRGGVASSLLLTVSLILLAISLRALSVTYPTKTVYESIPQNTDQE